MSLAYSLTQIREVDMIHGVSFTTAHKMLNRSSETDKNHFNFTLWLLLQEALGNSSSSKRWH